MSACVPCKFASSRDAAWDARPCAARNWVNGPVRDSQGDRIETFRIEIFRIEIFRTGTSRIRIPRIGTFRIEISYNGTFHIEISHSEIPCIETSHTGTFRKLAHTASLHPRRPAAMAWVTNTIGVTNTVGRVSQGNIKTSSIPIISSSAISRMPSDCGSIIPSWYYQPL